MPTPADVALHRYSEGRLQGLRSNRDSFWIHWRDLATFLLPRRYKWLVTPNQRGRGSPINSAIIDSSGTVLARNLASGLISGKSSPTQPWFKLKIGRLDSTTTSPVSLWLAECERLLYLIFSESNFYNSVATFFFDLVVFGTASLLIYEDFDTVINCVTPCLGEFFVDVDSRYRPTIFYREFTMTIGALVEEFKAENVSASVLELYNQSSGAGRAQEILIAHSIEPNNDGRGTEFGFSDRFEYRECYWERGGSANQQNNQTQSFLRRAGYYEQINITGRWDVVSNDPYGRSPGMDALPDIKQLQVESRRKAQAIDKMVNPPMVADVQMKNQPSDLTPGGVTYVQGFTAGGKPGFASVYDTKFPVQEITEDLNEVKQRLAQIFFNDVLRVASQFETRSNVTAVEWDLRKSESMVMLGPVLERIDFEVLKPVLERVFGIASRAGILPPAPPEIQGKAMDIEFVSILAQAQRATKAAAIERMFQVVGGLVGVDPGAMDNIDVDMALDIYSDSLGNDPRMIRSPEALQAIRQQRAQQQAAAQQADIAQKLSVGAANLSKTDVGGGQNALQQMQGG